MSMQASPDGARSRAWIVLALWLLALAGCSLLPEVKDETADWSAERLYREAHEAMLDGNYTRSVKLFEQLESRFPYGRYAQQAIVESAYANYRQGETAAAVAACDRFIRTYPNSPIVDYAYYLKGLVHFREDQGIFGYIYEQDLAERDPKEMKESFAAFKELTEKFPQSRYAEDARARMRYLTNALAMFEVNVARYYYNRGAYLAAANRAQAALVNYPRTPANEHALALMARSYEHLDMPQLAQDTRRILEKTFPESPYLSGKFASKRWWEFWEKGDAYAARPAEPKPWWKFW